MKIRYLFPFLLLLISCDHGSSVFNKPSGVLSKKEMVDLLVDLNLAESVIRIGSPSHVQPSDSLYQKSQFIKIFKDHGVEPDDFNKSLTYYSRHVDDLNEIYDEVIKRLSEMQASHEGKKAPPTAAPRKLP